MRRAPALLLSVALGFALARSLGPEPILPPPPSPWDAPLAPGQVRRLPLVEDYRAIVRDRGACPEGYDFRPVSDAQGLPPLGRGGRPQLYVYADGPRPTWRAARLTISAEDFAELVARIPPDGRGAER
jgi:hypothetical protein